LYGAYVVESMIRTYELSRRAGITIEGAVTWAFMFDQQPYFDGFRDLATNGIDKAVLNAFRMLGKLGGEWLATTSNFRRDITDIMGHGVRGEPDVDVVATRDDNGVSILVWHYHDDDEAGPDADVTISLGGWGERPATLTHFRMDADHSNAFALWQHMGKPQKPSTLDYARLEAAGRLAQIDHGTPVEVSGGKLTLRGILPRQGVSLLRLDW
jgi:xylan 1,4-beta-xylosidase